MRTLMLKKLATIVAFVFLFNILGAPVFAESNSENCLPGANVVELTGKEKGEIISQANSSKELQLLKKALIDTKRGDKVDKPIVTKIVTSENETIYSMVLRVITNNNPGMIGIVFKDGNSQVGAIVGSKKDASVMTLTMYSIENNEIITNSSEIPVADNSSMDIITAQSDYDLCVTFCNLACSIGWGWAGCTIVCAPVAGLLCPFLCATFTWTACNYGCPWYCNSIL